MSTIYFLDKLKEVKEDSPLVCAKYNQNKTGKRDYFIKKATSGPDMGRFYNPKSIYNDKYALNMKSNIRQNKLYEYEKVSEEVFNLYSRFLKTGNLTFLRQSERIIGREAR